MSSLKNSFQKFQKYFKTKKGQYFFWLFLLLMTWGSYFIYIWPKMLFENEKGIMAGWIGIWGDWSAHLTYANHFAYRSYLEWFLSHPLFIDSKFTYPFLMDFFSGILIKIGFNVVDSFVFPSIIFSILLLIIAYQFFYHILKSASQSFFAITIFLLSGGLGFIKFFKDIFNGFELASVFPPNEYTKIPEHGIECINIISSAIIPQRAFLLGLPFTLAIIYLLYKWSEQKFNNIKTYKLIIIGFVSSLLLIIHVHSYIVLVIVSFVFLIINRTNWKQFLIYAISSALPSLLLYISFYGGQISKSFFSWQPGWLSDQKFNIYLLTYYLIFVLIIFLLFLVINKKYKYIKIIIGLLFLLASIFLLYQWFSFWIINWGIFFIIAFYSSFKLKLFHNPFIITGWLLFLISNLVLFQPWAYDNSKILTWGYLFLSIAVIKYLTELWNKKVTYKILTIILFILIILSGLLDAYRITRTDKLSHIILNQQELKMAEYFKNISQPNDIVLCSDKHNHWVPTLTGRQILMGYRGWLWSYGINYNKVEADIMTMFLGDLNSERLLKDYNISYVVIGFEEINNFNANEEFFKSKYNLVLENEDYRVYQIK